MFNDDIQVRICLMLMLVDLKHQVIVWYDGVKEGMEWFIPPERKKKFMFVLPDGMMEWNG